MKGYISLEGASVQTVDHTAEPFAFTLSTPARRLSMMPPQQPGAAGGGPPAENPPSKRPSLVCPPSLDARMSLIEKLDNWGKHALRNMLADATKEGPVTTWTLAAHSAVDLQAWLDAFHSILAEGPTEDGDGHVQRSPAMAAVEVH